MNNTKIIESPKEFWKATRNDEYLKSTSGVAPGVRANQSGGFTKRICV